MTDKKFQEAIDISLKKLVAYRAALKKAENEYLRRYGHHPSDKDNDEWIDVMHVSGGSLTVHQVEESARIIN